MLDGLLSNGILEIFIEKIIGHETRCLPMLLANLTPVPRTAAQGMRCAVLSPDLWASSCLCDRAAPVPPTTQRVQRQPPASLYCLESKWGRGCPQQGGGS